MPMLTLVKGLSAQETSLPPRRSRPAPRQREYNRRRFLAWLRDEVAVLRALGLDHRRIAALLDIEEHDVRAFSSKRGSLWVTKSGLIAAQSPKVSG